MCCGCIDPLSNYPTAQKLSELKVDQWFKLGLQLGVTEDQLKNLKKRPQPTAATLLAAKVRNSDLNWKHVVESLVLVGEYKVAETVCRQQGWLLSFPSLTYSRIVFAVTGINAYFWM